MNVQDVETFGGAEGAGLELGMQELEAMEAPGFWSVTGYISGAGVSGAVTYSVVASVVT
ncbi:MULTISPECIES: daptide-type RiPP [Streptomyces]|uniref:Uncharacterized protein n=1 Tax=Streptomyces cacaoi TaxID=1898 RepID=A0A4Y3R3B9_STRCI|nr:MULTISPECIES: daptide-type RiPP [Streptomyces]NNG85594.1 hypothetical protein [Streptomyces cacaoi]GEB52004.1 hypothetical protein SCA03_45550 [Streptomyces cacaoi]